jgi:acyl-CoA synthetase (AMP-forming)/AMP-acid ligase II
MNASEADLVTYTRERLAHYKCPTSVVFADTLPRNASGKLLKRELRLTHGAQFA